MTTATLSAAELSSLSAVELAAALSAGKTDLISIVAHLSARKLGDDVSGLVPLLPLLGEYTAACMMAQASLHQAKTGRRELSPIRRSQGSRNVTCHPPVGADGGKKQWALTASRAGWRWIVQHAAEISAACDEADKADSSVIAKELAEKMKREAESAAKK